MGIKGLLPKLRALERDVHLRQFHGQRVGVDTYGWLHRGAFACSEQLLSGGSPRGMVDYCTTRLDMLLEAGLRPVFVFDGAPLPAKRLTEESRAQARQQKHDNYHELKAVDPTEARRHISGAIDITPQLAFHFIQVLRARRIPYVVAPYEADAQLAYLYREGIVDFVLTEDSDLLTFGCLKVFLKFKTDGTGKFLDLTGLPSVTEPHDFGLWGSPAHPDGLERFRDLCILSGCDYLQNIKNFGISKAYAQLNRLGSAEKVFLHNRSIFPAAYQQEFRRAATCFQMQRVWDVRRRCLRYLGQDPVTGDERAALAAQHRDRRHRQGAGPEPGARDSALRAPGPASSLAAECGRFLLDRQGGRPAGDACPCGSRLSGTPPLQEEPCCDLPESLALWQRERLHAGLSEEDDFYIGPSLPDSIVEQIVLGNVDPITFAVIDDYFPFTSDTETSAQITPAIYTSKPALSRVTDYFRAPARNASPPPERLTSAALVRPAGGRPEPVPPPRRTFGLGGRGRGSAGSPVAAGYHLTEQQASPYFLASPEPGPGSARSDPLQSAAPPRRDLSLFPDLRRAAEGLDELDSIDLVDDDEDEEVFGCRPPPLPDLFRSNSAPGSINAQSATLLSSSYSSSSSSSSFSYFSAGSTPGSGRRPGGAPGTGGFPRSHSSGDSTSSPSGSLLLSSFSSPGSLNRESASTRLFARGTRHHQRAAGPAGTGLLPRSRSAQRVGPGAGADGVHGASPWAGGSAGAMSPRVSSGEADSVGLELEVSASPISPSAYFAQMRLHAPGSPTPVVDDLDARWKRARSGPRSPAGLDPGTMSRAQVIGMMASTRGRAASLGAPSAGEPAGRSEEGGDMAMCEAGDSSAAGGGPLRAGSRTGKTPGSSGGFVPASPVPGQASMEQLLSRFRYQGPSGTMSADEQRPVNRALQLAMATGPELSGVTAVGGDGGGGTGGDGGGTGVRASPGPVPVFSSTVGSLPGAAAAVEQALLASRQGFASSPTADFLRSRLP